MHYRTQLRSMNENKETGVRLGCNSIPCYGHDDNMHQDAKSGAFDRYGFLFWNHAKKVFGVKMEVAVAFTNTDWRFGCTSKLARH